MVADINFFVVWCELSHVRVQLRRDRRVPRNPALAHVPHEAQPRGHCYIYPPLRRARSQHGMIFIFSFILFIFRFSLFILFFGCFSFFSVCDFIFRRVDSFCFCRDAPLAHVPHEAEPRGHCYLTAPLRCARSQHAVRSALWLFIIFSVHTILLFAVWIY